jgi:hypothetical protein
VAACRLETTACLIRLRSARLQNYAERNRIYALLFRQEEYRELEKNRRYRISGRHAGPVIDGG